MTASVVIAVRPASLIATPCGSAGVDGGASREAPGEEQHEGDPRKEHERDAGQEDERALQ